jgi:hypothetical protein
MPARKCRRYWLLRGRPDPAGPDAVTGCRAPVNAVGAMIAAGDFRHGQLSEYDSGLKRLDTRPAIGERDLPGARKAREAASAVARVPIGARQLCQGCVGRGDRVLR